MASYNYDDYKSMERTELIQTIELLKTQLQQAEIWQFKHEKSVVELHRTESIVYYLRALVKTYEKRIECVDITLCRVVRYLPLSWPMSFIRYLWRG